VSPKNATREPPPVVVLDAGAATDVGLRRKANEDSYITGYPIFAVADGMGGHDAGDRASQAVIHHLSTLVGKREIQPEALVAVLETARATVAAIADETERGAGSTVTGVAVSTHEAIAHWLVFNIGDSRVYRLRDGLLSQLSIDHSLVQQLLDSGELAPADIASFQGKNVITRAVGADDSDADFWMHPILQNERLLLCSDGLTAEASDDEIRDVMLATPGAQPAADALVKRALENGGRDNVTVVVLDVLVGGIVPVFDEETVLSSRRAAEAAENANADTVEIPVEKVRRGRA
jgi:serine/threonine protein phosphatase PrpC